MRAARNYAGLSDPAVNGQFSRRWQEDSPDSEGLHPIGDIAHKVMLNTAIRAVERWLQQADTLDGDDRMVCLETADAILRAAGLTWGNVLPERAA